MNDSLPQLPEYDPRPDLWSRIEADLRAEEHLNRVVNTLPTHEPKANLWDTIEQDLAKTETTTIRPLWAKSNLRQLWAGLAAAAVLLLIGLWWLWPSETSEQVRVEYAVEVPETVSPKKATSTSNQSIADKHAEEFIAKRCAEQKAVCQRPEVHELRNQLTALTIKQQRIERERQVFGNDPALVQAQVKIETQRAEVTKELLTLLES